MAFNDLDEEFGIALPTEELSIPSPPSDILLPPSTLMVDGANQQTIALHNWDTDFRFPSPIWSSSSALARSALRDELTLRTKPSRSSSSTNLQTLAQHNWDTDFRFPSPSNSDDLDLILKVLSPYRELEEKFEDLNSKVFGSNKYSRASRIHIHYAGVDYSKQMIAMMAFKETEDWYYMDLEKLIKYRDPRNGPYNYHDFNSDIDNLFDTAHDIRNLSEALRRGLQEATSEYHYATCLGDMLLATIPKLLQLYQTYIEALPATLAYFDLENPQDQWNRFNDEWKALISNLNLLPLPLLRLRHYVDSLASLIRLVQSSKNNREKSDLVTLICALSMMKELVNTIDSSAVNVEQHLTFLLSKEFGSKVELSYPQPLHTAMLYTGRDYPEYMLLCLTFWHSEWMYRKDLDDLLSSLDRLMRENEFNVKDMQIILANVKELRTLSQKFHRDLDQSFLDAGFFERMIDMFSKLARPYRQYSQHYSQVSACIQSIQEYEASLLALPMQRLRDYQDLIESIIQVTDSFDPDRQALLSAKSLVVHTLKMIETFSVEQEDHSDHTGMARPDSPPHIGHAVKLAQQYMIANGGFGSVYQGMYSDGDTRQPVAIKIFIKREIIDDAKFQKRLRREVKVWWRLQHPNVIPLLGISFDHGEYMSMISPWMEGGTLSSHLQKPASTLGIEAKLKFLNEIADGLQYLHNNRIVHGDLTTANILLDSKHNAVLADFGMSFLVDEFVGTSYMTTTIAGGGALRWAAPELVPAWEDINFQPVKGYESDIYSFGGVLYHVLSGHVPFHDKKDIEIFNLVVQLRQHPERPPDDLITDSCWNFIVRCWSSHQQHRPVISEVVRFMIKERVLRDCL